MSVERTILIVDDEPVIRDLLAIELRASYAVLVARDGIDAIRVYEHNVERIDAIVTDLEMPRLNGRLVTEWVHHISPQLPIIIMSGGGRRSVEDLVQTPTVSFLSKPFKPQQLHALLDRAIGEQENEAA